MRRFAFVASFLLLPAGLLSGCSYLGLTSHVTPQVSGRVLATDTRQPLAGVKVIRVLPGQTPDPVNPPKGAQLLQQGRTVTTDANGFFIFPSSSYMTFIRQASWWSLKLSFQASHYAPFQTNFTTTNISVRLADGTPLVQAGDVFLKSSSK
jgi:hypothetical protein